MKTKIGGNWNQDSLGLYLKLLFYLPTGTPVDVKLSMAIESFSEIKESNMVKRFTIS